MTITKNVHGLIEISNKNEEQTVNLAREIMVLMGERMNEINHCMTEEEQERSDPPSQAPSFSEIAGMTSSAPNVVYTPSSPSSTERIEKLEYKTCEVEREWKLLQVKVTHTGISSTSRDIDLHVKQFLEEQLNMSNLEVDDQMYVTELPQSNLVVVTLPHHRFKIFLFRAKKELRIKNVEVYCDLFL